MYLGATTYPGKTTFAGEGNPALLLEEFHDAPCPRVGITIVNLAPAEVSRVTVWRHVEGDRKRRAVRGGRNMHVTGSGFLIDYEVPLGVPVTYTLEVHAGSIIPEYPSAVITVLSATGWLQDPLYPASAIPVATDRTDDGAPYLASNAFSDFLRELPGELAQVLGAEDPTLLGGGRLAASGIPFDMFVRAAEWNTRLRNLLRDAGVVLLRGLGGPMWDPMPAAAYLRVSERELPPWPRNTGLSTRWQLTGDLVSPPALSVLVPVWTYDQVAALWATYQERQDAATLLGATYTDDQRDPTLGGVL